MPSQVERAFVARLTRRARGLSPSVAREQLAAYELIKRALNERELADAIRSGQVERLIMELLSDERLDPSLVRLRALVNRVVVDSARAETMQGLPSFIRPPVFDVLNPIVIQAAREVGLKYVDDLKNEIRQTVRQHVTAGLEEGINPRTVARGMRGVIGLAPNQERAVNNFERMLREGDAELFTRALRDRRHDRAIQRAFDGDGLTAEQVRRMTEAYRRRMVAFNAETHARTLALDTQKLAQRLAWDDAIARGAISPDNLVRTWVTVGDSRVRPEHVELNGERVGYYEPFPNGELTPGESTYNCRCQARVSIARKPKVTEVPVTSTQLVARLREKYPELRQLEIVDQAGDVIYLDVIQVEDTSRSRGIGSSVMRDLIAWADANRRTIVVDVAERDAVLGTTSRARLIEFYRRFGFTEKRGRAGVGRVAVPRFTMQRAAR